MELEHDYEEYIESKVEFGFTLEKYLRWYKI